MILSKLKSNIKNGALKKYSKILVFGHSGIGDTVLYLPFLFALRKKNPDSKIMLLSGAGRHLAVDRHYCDDAMFFRWSPQKDDKVHEFYFSNIEKFFLHLCEDYDLVIRLCFQPDEIIKKLLDKSGKDYMIYCNHLDMENPFRGLNETINSNHSTIVYMNLMRSLGIRDFTITPKIFLTEKEKKYAEKFYTKNGVDFKNEIVMALHAGSGRPNKMWPIERYIKVIRWLLEKYNAKILLIIGPGEQNLYNNILRDIDANYLITLKGKSVRESAAILSKATFYLGNDSGMMHVSAGVGLPTIAIFGPSDYKIFSANGPLNVIVKKYHIKEYIKKHKIDLGNPDDRAAGGLVKEISVKDVKLAVESVLTRLKLIKENGKIIKTGNLKINKIKNDGIFLTNLDYDYAVYIKRGANRAIRILRYIKENNKTLGQIKLMYKKDMDLINMLIQNYFLKLK